METSRYLNRAATPRLYETLVIYFDESSLDRSASLLRLIEFKPWGLVHVKNVIFAAHFRKNLKRRCPHQQFLHEDGSYNEEVTGYDPEPRILDPFRGLARDIRLLLSHFKDGSLHGLR